MAGQSFFFIFFASDFLFSNFAYYLYSMKVQKKLYILFLIGLNLKCITAFAAEAFQAELYADSKKTIGTRILLPFSEFKVSMQEDSMNYGFSFYTKSIFPRLPFSFKTGNLNGGGALSKLSNPTLTASSSAFSTGISSVNELAVTLPSYTSFSKDQSYFVQLEFPLQFKKNVEIKNLINVWLSPEVYSPLYSASIKASLAERKVSLALSAITGSFSYDAENSSSWITNQVYYKEGLHQCSLLQISGSYKIKSAAAISSSFTAGFYESPFGTLPLNLRADIDFKNKEIELFTSAFYNPQEGLITSSQKYISSCLQLKSGFITKKMTMPFNKPVFIKSGFNISATLNFRDSNQPLIANAGLQLSNELTTTSFSTSLKAAIPTERTSFLPLSFDFESLLIQLKTKWNLKDFSPSAEASITFTQKDSAPLQKYKFSTGLAYGKKYNFGGTISYSFSNSNKEISGKKITAGLNIRISLPFLTIIGKLSATLE